MLCSLSFLWILGFLAIQLRLVHSNNTNTMDSSELMCLSMRNIGCNRPACNEANLPKSKVSIEMQKI